VAEDFREGRQVDTLLGHARRKGVPQIVKNKTQLDPVAVRLLALRLLVTWAESQRLSTADAPEADIGGVVLR
jgi:hypothetical protein